MNGWRSLRLVFCGVLYGTFESRFSGKAFPGVYVLGRSVSGEDKETIKMHVQNDNNKFFDTDLTIEVEDKIATTSASELSLGYDGDLIATQALSFGRSDAWMADAYFKTRSFVNFITHTSRPIAVVAPDLSYNTQVVADQIHQLSQLVSYPAQEPQFEFDKNTKRVLSFKLGTDGKELDTKKAEEQIASVLKTGPIASVTVKLSPQTVSPKTGNEDIDNLGITELIGQGESYYRGSISGRIHNVVLASSRTSGILVAPNQVFSFNDTVGDISAATGYESAYIIKNGRTELGDGGGVCQVSTTLFRAALNAGLEIVERHAHSYRVAYYEQGGFKPGLDATVFYPSVDLKIRNNTPHYILIVADPEPKQYKLTFEIYGKNDGRSVELSDIRVGSQTPAPPPLYQEDPTLASGQVKQVDWAATGTKTTFDYKVTKQGQVLGASTFVSNFKPWQAVYLYGPGTAVPQP